MYNAGNGGAMLRNGAKNTHGEPTHPGHDTMHPSWSRRRTGPVQGNSRSTKQTHSADTFQRKELNTRTHPSPTTRTRGHIELGPYSRCKERSERKDSGEESGDHGGWRRGSTREVAGERDRRRTGRSKALARTSFSPVTALFAK